MRSRGAPALGDLPKKAVFLDIRLFAPPGFAFDPFGTESTDSQQRMTSVAQLSRSGYVRNRGDTARS